MNSRERKEELREDTLANLKIQWAGQKANGIQRYYSVFVNGSPVLTMSDNPNELEKVKSMIFPETSTIRVITYKDYNGDIEDQVLYQRPAQQPTVVPIQQPYPYQLPGLSGTEIDDRIKTAVDAAWQKWELQRLQKELGDTKRQLAEANQTIDELDVLIEELQKNKGKIGNVHVGEIASVMLESFMRRNVDKIKNLPGGSALAGLLSDNPPSQHQPTQDTAASFEQINDPVPSWWDDVQAAFTAEEIEYIKAIIAHLVQQKEKIITVLELLIQK